MLVHIAIKVFQQNRLLNLMLKIVMFHTAVLSVLNHLKQDRTVLDIFHRFTIQMIALIRILNLKKN